MICTKCGHELPDGARFCTVCGTAVVIKSAEPSEAAAKKSFCTKCGNELKSGAKFCTICGAPAAEIGNVAPAQNNGAAFGSESADAVPFNNEPNANDLVAAMNAVSSTVAPAAAPVSVPTPVSAAEIPVPSSSAASVQSAESFAPASNVVPEPTETHINLEKPQMPTVTAQEFNTTENTAPAAQPVQPTQPMPEFNGGFSAPTTEAYPSAPQVPNFAPSGSSMPNDPMSAGFNGMNGAAAVTAAPAKKGKGLKIVLIIVIVLAVLIGGVAVFFFTNKVAFLSIVMGKPKYAATVEKASIMKMAEKLDAEDVCDQIKSFSSLMSALSGADINPSNPIPSLRLSGKNADPEFVKLANSASRDGVDVKAFIKGYNEFMQNVYGGSGISGKVSVNLAFGDKMKDEIDEDAQDLIDLLFNGSEITYDFAATDKLFGIEGGLKINGKPIDARVSVEDDGTAYISFPFASEKALKVKMPTSDNGTAQESAVLDLDPKELERLIKELVDIYTNYIKQSSVTMENGTMVVGDATVNGKQITADISGISLENLLKELLNHIANDTYLCDKITAYGKNFDDSFTAEDYKTEFTDVINSMKINENDKLVVTTIVTNSGKVLSKNYAATSAASKGKVEIAYANDDTRYILEAKENDKTVLSVNNVKTSEKEGTVTVTVGTGNNESVGVVVTYKDADKAEFGKREIAVGSYTLKFDTSNVKNKDEDTEMLDGFTLSYTSSVESGAAKVTAGVELKDYIKADISEEMTITNDASKFAAPSDVIDISAAINGEEPDEDTMNAVKEYAKDLLNGVANVFEGTDFESIVSQYKDEAVKELDRDEKASNGAIELEQKVWNEYMEVYNWLNESNVYSGTAYDNVIAYQAKLSDLDERIYKAYANCTKEQLEGFQKEYDELMTKKNALKSALEKAGKNNGSGSTSNPNGSKSSKSSKSSQSGKTSQSSKSTQSVKSSKTVKTSFAA